MRIPQRHIFAKYQNPPSSDGILEYLRSGVHSAMQAGEIDAACDWVAATEDLNLYRQVAAILAPMN